MINWKIEGEHVRQGLSIYRPSDKSSAGGCLRIGNHWWNFRYSKITKKFYTGYAHVNPNALKEWEEKNGLKHE